MLRGDRRERRRRRIDRRRRCAGTSAARGSDQTWCSEEAAVACALVAREQRHSRPLETEHDAIGERRQRGGVGLERPVLRRAARGPAVSATPSAADTVATTGVMRPPRRPASPRGSAPSAARADRRRTRPPATAATMAVAMPRSKRSGSGTRRSAGSRGGPSTRRPDLIREAAEQHDQRGEEYRRRRHVRAEESGPENRHLAEEQAERRRAGDDQRREHAAARSRSARG